MPAFIVAIDGPAGAGKSTIARQVAERLSWPLVDTGAIYRCVALLAHERGLTEEKDIAGLTDALPLRFDGTRVLLGDRDVSAAIRTPEISQQASIVSAMKSVRRGLLELQRRIANESTGAVLEGRDIGTVVFPDAAAKIFLTATIEERARRRTRDLADAGTPRAFDEVLADIEVRDDRDSNRAVSPLTPAEDAIQLDSTEQTIPEVVAQIVELVRSRMT